MIAHRENYNKKQICFNIWTVLNEKPGNFAMKWLNMVVHMELEPCTRQLMMLL